VTPPKYITIPPSLRMSPFRWSPSLPIITFSLFGYSEIIHYRVRNHNTKTGVFLPSFLPPAPPQSTSPCTTKAPQVSRFLFVTSNLRFSESYDVTVSTHPLSIRSRIPPLLLFTRMWAPPTSLFFSLLILTPADIHAQFFSRLLSLVLILILRLRTGFPSFLAFRLLLYNVCWLPLLSAKNQSGYIIFSRLCLWNCSYCNFLVFFRPGSDVSLMFFLVLLFLLWRVWACPPFFSWHQLRPTPSLILSDYW